MFGEMLTSLRLAIASVLICVIGYGAAVLLSAKVVAPTKRLIGPNES